MLWAFPLYWGLVTTFKPEDEVVRPGVQLWPEHFTFENYVHVVTTDQDRPLVSQFAGHLGCRHASLSSTMAAGAGYAISQLDFPGRRLFWWMILASFMVPIPALIVNHFILMSQFHWINTWAGVVAPQLIAPVTVIIYKQFFDSVPKDFREAAVDRRRQRISAPLSHLSADELGHHHCARHHHLHRRLESLPMAVPCCDRPRTR